MNRLNKVWKWFVYFVSDIHVWWHSFSVMKLCLDLFTIAGWLHDFDNRELLTGLIDSSCCRNKGNYIECSSLFKDLYSLNLLILNKFNTTVLEYMCVLVHTCSKMLLIMCWVTFLLDINYSVWINSVFQYFKSRLKLIDYRSYLASYSHNYCSSDSYNEVCGWFSLSTGMTVVSIRWARIFNSHLMFVFWLSLHIHYNDVIMSTMASQINSLMIVYSTVYSDIDERKHQNSSSLVFVRGIHRWPVNSLHKGPVTRKVVPFDDVIMHSVRNIRLKWTTAPNVLSMNVRSPPKMFLTSSPYDFTCKYPKINQTWFIYIENV